MAAEPSPTIHASAVLIGARAAVIRGAPGAGKSQLALALIEAAATGLLPFARLVADDRTILEVAHGRLLVRPAASLAGLMEIRGLGIRRLPFEPVALVGIVVDLAATDANRLPTPAEREVVLAGVALPRLAVAPGSDALRLVIAALRTSECR